MNLMSRLLEFDGSLEVLAHQCLSVHTRYSECLKLEENRMPRTRFIANKSVSPMKNHKHSRSEQASRAYL